MRTTLVAAIALSIAGFGAESVNYDSVRQGQLPPGWSSPTAQKWGVHADKTAPSHPNVFRAAGGAPESEPPLAVFDKVVCRDGDLSVKFRIEGGSKGTAAGIIWRYQDPGNYYVVSLSTDEKNVVLRHIKNGVSESLASAPVAGDVKPGEWHVVKVTFRGPKVQVFFGNRSLFTAQDSGILAPGRTGVWFKGPSGAAFDDFRIDRKG